MLEDGAQIVDDPQQPVPMRVLGHVTSSYMSAALGHSIALALLENGRARTDQHLFAPMADRAIGVRVVSPAFLREPLTETDRKSGSSMARSTNSRRSR